MWDLIVSVPDHCLSFYFTVNTVIFFSPHVSLLAVHLCVNILWFHVLLLLR